MNGKFFAVDLLEWNKRFHECSVTRWGKKRLTKRKRVKERKREREGERETWVLVAQSGMWIGCVPHSQRRVCLSLSLSFSLASVYFICVYVWGQSSFFHCLLVPPLSLLRWVQSFFSSSSLLHMSFSFSVSLSPSAYLEVFSFFSFYNLLLAAQSLGIFCNWNFTCAQWYPSASLFFRRAIHQLTTRLSLGVSL